MRKHLLLSVTLFLGILFPYPSSADASDCPENWNIPAPTLSINWEAGSNSFVSNFGEAFGVSEPITLSFKAGSYYENLVKKVGDFFGADFVDKLRAEGGNVGLRDVLAIEPTFNDLSKITDRTPLNRFPANWNYLTNNFNNLNSGSLLLQGLLLEDIEGRKVKHFLEITKRGCSNVRVITSNEVTIPKSGISQSPIGMDEWTRGAENYLRDRYEVAEKRTVNWLTFDSNINKFKEVLSKLESLSKTTDPPFDIPAELKPVVYVGEDDYQFVPYLMGIPVKKCFWDSWNQNPYYFYLDKSVSVRSTPCKIIAIAPDYQNMSIDSKNAQGSIVLVEVIDIPVRKILTRSETVSIFQTIVTKLISERINPGPQDVDSVYAEFEEEVSKLGITEFLAEGRDLIILKLDPELAKANAELKAKMEAVQKANAEIKARILAEVKAAEEELARQLSEGLIEPCTKIDQTIIVSGYKYMCILFSDGELGWEYQRKPQVIVAIPKPAVVYLGYQGPLTGGEEATGIDQSNAIKFVIDRYNSLNPSTKVELILFDDQGDPAIAGPLAAEISKKTEILGLVGPAYSGATMSSIKSYKKAGLALISPSATRASLTDPASPDFGGPVFHRVVATDDKQGPALAKYATAGVTNPKIFIFDDQSQEAKSLAIYVTSGLKGVAGATVVGTGSIADTTTDFSSTIAKIATSKADVVIYTGYYSQAAAFIKQLRDSGSKAVFAGGDGVFNQEFPKLAGASAEGSRITYPLGGNLACVSETLESDFKNKMGVSSGAFAVNTMDAVNIFLQGIAAGVTTRANMLSWVKEYRGKGFGGNIVAFTENGDAIQPNQGNYVVLNGKFECLNSASENLGSEINRVTELTLSKTADELKIKEEAEANWTEVVKEILEAEAAADLKVKQEAEAKALREKIISEAKAEAAKILAAAKAAVATKKKITITCVKGKVTKKVTAVKPVCPKGYKKK
jgi:branched-chain amino acid transport system substrate-binding protein